MKHFAGMSKTILVAVFALCMIAQAASAADQKIKAKVPGITWASSAMAASDAAKSLPGISYVDDDMMNATLTIIFDDTKTDIGRIKTDMKKAGFPLEGEPEMVKQ